eukprot:jgi/Chrzof1/3739/Cz13g07050.t1
MRVATVSGYDINGKTYYAALFIGKLSGPWDNVWGQPSKAHDTYETGILKEGFCPSWTSAFTINDRDYFNSMWEKPASGCPRDWVTDHEIVGVEAFQGKVDQYVKERLRPFWATGFGSTEHKFATIWKKQRVAEEWAISANLVAAGLQKQLTKIFG